MLIFWRIESEMWMLYFHSLFPSPSLAVTFLLSPSLSPSQIEERAIQDLLLHYGAANNPDEFIVVERASRGPIATPRWNKH